MPSSEPNIGTLAFLAASWIQEGLVHINDSLRITDSVRRFYRQAGDSTVMLRGFQTFLRINGATAAWCRYTKHFATPAEYSGE